MTDRTYDFLISLMVLLLIVTILLLITESRFALDMFFGLVAGIIACFVVDRCGRGDE